MSKTALVLSSGGMFGAFQAGAWKTIASLAPPDIVVGASVGGLNAWAIAGGCSPDRLASLWLHQSAGDTLKLRPRRGLIPPTFDPAGLRSRAEMLCRDFTPQLPLGIVVARLPTFKHILVEYPDLTADHLQATCSILVFLPVVPIAGRYYADGGLFEKLPIWAAIQMGATRIVAVDAMPELDNRWMRAANAFARAVKPARRYPQGFDITVISPSQPLGTVNDGVTWSRANAARWIALGEQDAAAALTAHPAHSDR